MSRMEQMRLFGVVSSYVGPLDRAGIPGLLWERRKRFLAVFASVSVVLAAILLSLQPTYIASASVIIGEREPTINNTSPAWIQKLGDPADLESQLLVIQSPRLLRQVLLRPSVIETVRTDCDASRGILSRMLGRGIDCKALNPDEEKSLEFVRARYSVRAVGRSRVIAISYSSTNPEIAERMANAMAEGYIEDHRSASLSGRQSSTAVLRRELGRIEQELGDIERRVQEFRSANGLVRGANSALVSEQLTAATQQLAVAEAAEADALAAALEVSKGESSKALESPLILQLKQQLAQTTARVSSLSTTLMPAHPTMRALLAAEQDTKRALKAEQQNIAQAAQRTYEVAKQKSSTLREQVKRLKGEASGIAQAEGEIATLVRSGDAKRSVYVELSRRIGELESEELVGTTRLVNSAERPTQPNFPRRMPVLAASLSLGLVLAFAACCADRLFK